MNIHEYTDTVNIYSRYKNDNSGGERAVKVLIWVLYII
jgi:hypothetical protein